MDEREEVDGRDRHLPSLPLSFTPQSILLRVRRISADMRTDECDNRAERLRGGARGRHGMRAHGSTWIEMMVEGEEESYKMDG